MRRLAASEWLAVWELGLSQSPAQRTLTLLEAACPGASPEDLARLSIGQRDARLMNLREWTFGPKLVCLTTCPKCGERLELTFNGADIRTLSPSQPSCNEREGKGKNDSLTLCSGDYEISFRLPSSINLAAVDETKEMAESRRLLLQQCLLKINHHGEEVSVEGLPTEVEETVVKRMAKVDPQGDLHLSLSCPECRHEWLSAFDIATFFWIEIDAWAHRILREVHILASAYGWQEADILAMSHWRRQYYLAMITG